MFNNNEALNLAKKELRQFPSPFLDAEVLLAHVWNKAREWIFVNSDKEIPLLKFNVFQKLIQERIAGKPVAYLTNEKEFYGLKFFVDERVLIPRPETELLVEEIINFCQSIPNNYKAYNAPKPCRDGAKGYKKTTILDVGTGSGCIAIALAKNLPKACVSACDISPTALTVARKNAKQHKVSIKFYKSDLLTKVPGNFKVIVANLPYITEESVELEKNVKKYEPSSALFGGNNGLKKIEKLLQQISEHKEKPKLILLEIGSGQKIAIKQIVNKLFPKSKISSKKDLAGHDRVVRIELE